MLNSDFTVADRVTFISTRKSLQIVLCGGKWNGCLHGVLWLQFTLYTIAQLWTPRYGLKQSVSLYLESCFLLQLTVKRHYALSKRALLWQRKMRNQQEHQLLRREFC